MSETKKMSVGEFKTNFSKAVEWVKSGKKIAVTFGKKKEVVGYFVGQPTGKELKRQLGRMKDKASAIFDENFRMTEEDFLGK